MTGIGLALPAKSADDHFIVALVNALAEPLIQQGWSLVTRVVHDEKTEQAVYRHWAQVGGVDAIALIGVTAADPRPALLRSLGFAHAGVVDASIPADFATVVVDANASVGVLKAFLESRPRRRAVYLTGPAGSDATASRLAAARAIENDRFFEVVRTEHSVEAAVAAGIDAASQQPTTLIFDSDVHAAAALTAFQDRGSEVPHDVALVSWTNSVLCQSTSPRLTAIDRRASEIGALLGIRIIDAVAGDLTTRQAAPDPIVVVGETA